MTKKIISLTDLQARIEVLEAEVKSLKAGRKKADPRPKSDPKPAAPADINKLLADLEKAKGDKKLSSKIRRQLRKAGYSLRENNGKAKTEKPEKAKAKTTGGKKNTKLRKKEK